jgi:hypothetical protein
MSLLLHELSHVQYKSSPSGKPVAEMILMPRQKVFGALGSGNGFVLLLVGPFDIRISRTWATRPYLSADQGGKVFSGSGTGTSSSFSSGTNDGSMEPLQQFCSKLDSISTGTTLNV